MLNSCFVNQPKYYLSGTNEAFPSDISERKWAVAFHNFSSSAEQEVKTQIIADFQSLFQNNIKFQSDFLNFDNFRPGTERLSNEELQEIKEESDAEFFAFFKIYMKYEVPTKMIWVEKRGNEKYRNMFIFLEVYDLKTNELIYTKQAISQLKFNDSGDFIPEVGVKKQAIKTYEKLKKDFIQKLEK